MSKKLIFGLLMICVVAGLVAVGTWAYFSDVEYSEDNTFAAGSLDLKVDGFDDPAVPTFFNVECVKPGDFGSATITLTNDGECVDALADLHIMNLVDKENGRTEPEKKLGDTGPVGELSQYMKMTITVTDAAGVQQWYKEGWLDGLECNNYVIGPLNPDDELTVVITWEVPAGTGDIIQTDTVEFDIEFSLDQAVGEPCLEVVGIVQPDDTQPCEDLEVGVLVMNQGGKQGACTVDVLITRNGTDVAEVLDTPTGTVMPGQTVEVDIPGSWHVEDDWVGQTITVTAQTDEECCAGMGEPLKDTILVLMPFTCDIVSIDQPDDIQPCEELTIAVVVENLGEKDGECDLTVTITDEAGDPVLGTPVTVGTGLLPPEQPTTVTVINAVHVPETLAGQTIKVTATCCTEDEETCTIDVLTPPSGEIIAIDQPESVQICEAFQIGVTVKNVGGKPFSFPVYLTITNEAGIVVDEQESVTLELNPTEQETVWFDKHAEDDWRGTCEVTTLPIPLPELHYIDVLKPGCIEATNIQQPDVVEEGTYLGDLISVDIHNSGDKPGECTLTVAIMDPLNPPPPMGMGEYVAGPVVIPVSLTIPPCTTDKVPLAQYVDPELWHVDETWPDDVMVIAFACCQNPLLGEMAMCPIHVIHGPVAPPIGGVDSWWEYSVQYGDDSEVTTTTYTMAERNVGTIPGLPPPATGDCVTIPSGTGPYYHMTMSDQSTCDCTATDMCIFDGTTDSPYRSMLDPVTGEGIMMIIGCQGEGGDTYGSESNLTDQYVVAPSCGKIISTMVLTNQKMTAQIAYGGYTTGTGSIGYPYTVGDKWTYTTQMGSYLHNFFMCASALMGEDMPPSICETEVMAVGVANPSGGYSGCVEIWTTCQSDDDGDGAYGEDPIDDIDNDGDELVDEDPVETCASKMWWSPTVKGMVEQIDTCGFDLPEYRLLTSYHLEP